MSSAGAMTNYTALFILSYGKYTRKAITLVNSVSKFTIPTNKTHNVTQ